MRTKLLLAGIATILVGGGAWLLREQSLRAEIETAVSAAELRREHLRTELKQSEQRLTAVADETAQVRAKAEAVSRKAATAKAATPKKAPPAPSIAAARQAILNDPHLQNLQLAAVQLKLNATYGPLCEQLKLSPTQRDQFMAIVRKRGEQEMDLSAIAETQRLPVNDPGLAKMKQQMNADFHAAQVALLGEAGSRELENYERTVPVREFVNELAGATVVTGAGLTGAQADALTDILAHASSPYRQGGPAVPRSLDWNQALTAAEQILSDRQMAVFRNGVIQLRNMEELRELARQ